ncbi:YopT-type cysteine protease domain-containing protein [Pseudomonas syringae group genomosp. 3]|uniref:YopT-type cysteine protease domain-containing protein n=1 Tax=Pseudomonas syringae group genomosp. 3 TaxID=251701 RepID=UPI00217FEB52|nr:YopT-type cysteine protease domain-containing protein [Pseudomonas syringae group genomosp. 3]
MLDTEPLESFSHSVVFVFEATRMRVSNRSAPVIEYTTQTTIGGCSGSSASHIKEIPFNQESELSRVGDQRAACVVFTAAWLDRIRHYAHSGEARIDHMRHRGTLEDIAGRQQIYRNHEINNPRTPYNILFSPTFRNYSLQLSPARVLDIVSDEDQAMETMANTLREANSSHVLVVVRANGDNHAIATHSTGNKLHVFDPNHGEYSFRSDIGTVKESMREIIQAYSSRFPVPEIHVLPARS